MTDLQSPCEGWPTEPTEATELPALLSTTGVLSVSQHSQYISTKRQDYGEKQGCGSAETQQCVSCSSQMLRKKNQKRYMQVLDSEWRMQNGTMQNASFVHLLLMNRRSRSQKRVISGLQYQ